MMPNTRRSCARTPPSTPATARAGLAAEVLCPCGTTAVLVCGGCRDAVFAAIAPGTWCPHAEDLAASGVLPPGAREVVMAGQPCPDCARTDMAHEPTCPLGRKLTGR